MKRIFTAMLAMLFCFTACGKREENTQTAESTELIVFAASSLTETLTEIAERYRSVAPGITLTFNFDSSGTLGTQIREGAVCDLFLSAAPKQMDALDGTLIGNSEKNPDSLDLLVSGSRINLLENKVTLAVPAGNPKGITGFDRLAELLRSGDVLLAVGNSDVPVGQYTQKLFSYYGIDEAAISSCLSYGSNVKEVTTAVSEGTVDCGVIYATDACSAGLTVADEATEAMCGRVIYPAAILASSDQQDVAAAFLSYLQTEEALSVFEAVGFSAAF